MPKSLWFILAILLIPLIGFLIYVNSPPDTYQSTGGPVFPRPEAVSPPPQRIAPSEPAPAIRAKTTKPVSSLQYLRPAPELLKAKSAAAPSKQNPKTSKNKKKKSKKHRKPSSTAPATTPPKPKLQLQTN